MIAANLRPGLMRIKCGMLGFQVPPALRWKSGQIMMDTWKALLQEATQEAREGLEWISDSGQIEMVVNDIHAGALEICEASLRQAGLANVVTLREGDCKELELKDKKCFIVTNPPWGVRLTDDMEESWESLRSFLRRCAAGTEAWVLSGNKDATKHLGLRRSQSMVLKTADQDLRWIQYMIMDKSGRPIEAEIFDYNADETETSAPRLGHNRSDSRQLEKWSDTRQSERRPSNRPEYKRSSQSGGLPSGYKARSAVMGRASPLPKRKGDTEPLTQKDRELRKNSWNL